MTRRSLRWAVLAVAALAAAAAGVYVGLEGMPGQRPDGAALLAVSLPDASDKETPLAQWKGKVLVVNFWATWCAPCRDEMPEFVRAQRELGGRGLQFVGIAVDEPDKVARFAQELGLNYPALIGGYGAMELSKSLGNRMMALPFTVVVDRSGRIAHTQLGPLREAKLRAIVGDLL
jgi:peroxiredoxin